jgi:hypothetical protein
MFCRKEGKWTEVPCVQLFFFLRDHPEWLNKYRLDTQTIATLYKKPPSALLLPPYPATSHTRHRPTGLYPLQLIPGGIELMFLLE